ncbi:MAG TPA: dienelactone hydrolase family protein [Azospirillum sp.]|nr:dienelactone hydrolase family protein [Azospirillum sp.]
MNMPVTSSTEGIRELTIPPIGLQGRLGWPRTGMGVILFAHGSGSGRFSPRNNYVADALRAAGLGTLLLDLLTEDEAADRRKVFDIDLLAQRLVMAATWLHGLPELRDRPLGYFGASTGAGAALVASTLADLPVKAVVSRGGRPDLAGDALRRVTAPTLLIVGGADHPVITMNREALDALPVEKDLAIVPGAGHLFEEPGALDKVIDLARAWFVKHLEPLT